MSRQTHRNYEKLIFNYYILNAIKSNRAHNSRIFFLTYALPEEGGRNPVSMLMMVVLPAPFGPSSAKSWRFAIHSHGAFTAWNSLPRRLNVARRPRISIAEPGAIGPLSRVCAKVSSASTSSSVLGSMTLTMSTTWACPNPQYEGSRK